jgi:ABC-type sugar transport system ATPase subunit
MRSDRVCEEPNGNDADRLFRSNDAVSLKPDYKIAPILQIKNVHKSFQGIKALDGAALELYDREILALLGDNGAGKSTLIKIISGAYQPDEAEIYVFGKAIARMTPHDSRRLGIKTVYQDLAIFPVLDVSQNLFMGSEMSYFGFLQKRKMDKASRKVLDGLRTTVKSLRQKIETLSGGQQHSVSIGRTVFVGATPRILIMDEPTAGLGVEESREVLEILKELRRNVAIILISHNLDHVFAVADRAVVLRQGKVNGVVNISETSIEEIVSLMVCR